MGTRKNAAAVELAKRRMTAMTAEERKDVARSGGLKGGPARAEKLSPAQRKKIAKQAAAARWDKKGAKKT